MILEELRGLITTDVGERIAAVAAGVPTDQAIVELGSFKGMSTAYLAAGARAGQGARVFAVDPWDLPGNPYGKHGYCAPIVREEFERQLRAVKLWSRVTPIQGFSVDVAATWDEGPVGFLFVDADHEEASVRADVAAWRPHLAQNHRIVLDDLDTPRNPGVRVVAEELAGDGYTFIAEGRLALLCPA